MNICLYCPREALSQEHPLPVAFGEFKDAPRLVNRICVVCNNTRLGVLDEHMTRCGHEAFFRRWFGIEGRSSHAKVNPHYRGSAGGRRLEMKAYDESLGTELELECFDGQVRQSCQLIFADSSGKTYHLPIHAGVKDPESLLAAYQKLGVVNPVSVRLICDPEESVWVEPLIKAAWPGIQFGERTPAATSYKAGAAIKIQVSDRYFREVAKIGFHYFLTQFPEFSGAETQFAEIRKFIIEDGSPVERANVFIGEREHPLLGAMMDGSRPDGWIAHVIAGEIRPEACLAHVQLFVSEHYRAPAYTVRLTSNFVTAQVSAKGHAYIYSGANSPGESSGIAVPLDCTYSSAPPPPVKQVVIAASKTETESGAA